MLRRLLKSVPGHPLTQLTNLPFCARLIQTPSAASRGLLSEPALCPPCSTLADDVTCSFRYTLVMAAYNPGAIDEAVAKVLTALGAGEKVHESTLVDFEEEAGRRGVDGRITPGAPENELVAQKLAPEVARMANTPGGGALIVGVADDQQLIGAVSDPEWLRFRLYQLTNRLVTVDVRQVHVAGTRLLDMRIPESPEPVRYHQKLKWRVADNCVEIDAATWHERRREVVSSDWTAEDSEVPVEKVRHVALEHVRDSLRERGDSHSMQLAEENDLDLLRRLGALTAHNTLTVAGQLFFVGRGEPALDYMYRDYEGAPSRSRVAAPSKSLAEELREVFIRIEAHLQQIHTQYGPTITQNFNVPLDAAREAVVNGVAHRDWHSPLPTVVEHIEDTLAVTSPGGFYGSVTQDNLLTHPSLSRNRALTQLLADTKFAEREGIGVDKMTAAMVIQGAPAPAIREIPGPYVRTVLTGGTPNAGWMTWLNAINPVSIRRNVSTVLLLDHVVKHGWFDASSVATVLQRSSEEAATVVTRVAGATLNGHPLIVSVEGVPDGKESAWALSERALQHLKDCDANHGSSRKYPSAGLVARTYAAARGRISSTELGSILHKHYTNVGHVLKDLSEEGILLPSNPSGRGQGFHYTYVGD